MAEPLRWQDLTRLSPRQRTAELLLPLPWLLLAWGLAAAGACGLALVATAPFFTAALRLTHDTYHRNLGLSRRESDVLLFVLSLLLGGALHAIEYTHLRHHRYCLGDDDTEGRISRYRFWSALVRSPLYPLLIHREALRDGSARQRRWVRRELAAVALLQALIWGGGDGALQTLSLALLAANALVPMIGIWSVHRGCAPGQQVARSSRHGWLQRISFNMLYHHEHHAYPGVPARHLPRLAQRLDACGHRPAPDLIAPDRDSETPARCAGRGSHGIGRRHLAVVLLAIGLTSCAPPPSTHDEIDVCALVLDTAADYVAAPLALPEPASGTLAGGCLIRSTEPGVAAQIEVHVYTAAAARRNGRRLEQQWQVLLAEARNHYGNGGDAPSLRRARATAWFGTTSGDGQFLIEGRGIVLEIGLHRVPPEHVAVLAAQIWRRLLRS